MTNVLFNPSTEYFRGDFSNKADISRAADLVANGQALTFDNDWVHGVLGDGSNPDFVQAVEAAKGREPGRTFGLSIPAERFLTLVNHDLISREIWPLLDDSDAFVSHFGAITFVRAPSRSDTLFEQYIPTSVISRPASGAVPYVQNWSPEGKANTTALLQQTSRLGVEFPAVTSLNASGKPEITDRAEAIIFAKSVGLPILTDAEAAKTNFRGSYPIIELTSTGISIIRARATGVGSTLLRRLLPDLPLDVPNAASAPEGLDIAALEHLKGPDLRHGLLEAWGWTAVAAAANQS